METAALERNDLEEVHRWQDRRLAVSFWAGQHSWGNHPDYPADAGILMRRDEPGYDAARLEAAGVNIRELTPLDIDVLEYAHSAAEADRRYILGR